MFQRFIGVAGAAGRSYPHVRGADGGLQPKTTLVDMAGVRLPDRRIRLCVEHDYTFRAGWLDWFEIGPDLALRIRGEVHSALAAGFARPDGTFGLSWFLAFDEVVPFCGGIVNGQYAIPPQW